MSLLVLDRVTKHYGARVALESVSLTVEPGEFVGVWGRRRSGRTTLLAVSAGLEAPSDGTVHFDGADVTRQPATGARNGIGYCTRSFPAPVGSTVLEQVSMPLLGHGSSVATAQRSAAMTLIRVGAAGLKGADVGELGHAAAMRVSLARALVTAPRLLLIDQPAAGVSIATERDVLLGLLRSLADEGMAVVMTVDEAAELAGTDRALTIDAGELHGETPGGVAADVIPLPLAGDA